MFKIGRVRVELGGVILIVVVLALGVCMWHGHSLSQALDKAAHDHTVVPSQKVLPTQECKSVSVDGGTKQNDLTATPVTKKTIAPRIQDKPKPVVSPNQDPPRTAVCPSIDPANSLAVVAKTDMTLDAVHFRRNSARLDLDGKKLLVVFAKQLTEQHDRQKATLEVTVIGHADSTGKPDRNLRLSKRRAETVKKFLHGHMVAGTTIEIASQGDTAPVGDNKTYDGRELNRRVELQVKKK